MDQFGFSLRPGRAFFSKVLNLKPILLAGSQNCWVSGTAGWGLWSATSTTSALKAECGLHGLPGGSWRFFRGLTPGGEGEFLPEAGSPRGTQGGHLLGGGRCVYQQEGGRGGELTVREGVREPWPIRRHHWGQPVQQRIH